MIIPNLFESRLTTAASYVALVLAAMFWAGNMLTGRAVHDVIAPTVLSFWRWLLILTLLLPFVARELGTHRKVLVDSWRILLLLAILSTGLFNSLVFLSLHYTTATNAALLNSTIPLWTVLAAYIILRERISFGQSIGLLVSFIGLTLVVAAGDFNALLALRINRGDGLMLCAMMMWGVYSVCLRRRPAGLSALCYLWVTGAIGLLLLIPAMVLEWLALGPTDGYNLATYLVPDRAAWPSIVYLAVFPSICATVLYNKAVDRLGAFRASQAIYLVPVFASVIAARVLDEPLKAYHLIGFALILAGLIFSAKN